MENEGVTPDLIIDTTPVDQAVFLLEHKGGLSIFTGSSVRPNFYFMWQQVSR